VDFTGQQANLAEYRHQFTTAQVTAYSQLGSHTRPVTALSHSELLARTAPAAELLVLPVVHLSNVERQEDFVAALRTFVQR